MAIKLKNKKTGEIVLIDHIFDQYNSIAELNEEWEDYEEPKEYWFMNSLGEVLQPSDTSDWDEQAIEYHKAIGNYFSSREEAEKAVEKLKAVKRLKDKGFRFTGFAHKDRGRMDELEIYCQLGECPEDIEDMEDVHLFFFGGEE